MQETIRYTATEGELRPIFTHVFQVEEAADWLVLNVKPNSKYGYVYVLDPLGRMRIHYLTKGSETTLTVGVSAADSSCGSVPGEIPPGFWTLLYTGTWKESPSYEMYIQTGTDEMVQESSVYRNSGNVWTDISSSEPAAALHLSKYDWNRVYHEGLRWYKGDFHMHTQLSDGKQTAQQLNDSALSRGLDFITVTEHNLMTTGWPESPLMVIPGIEVTSTKGHYNVLGIRQWIDLAGDGSGRPDKVNDQALALESENGIDRILAHSRQQGAVCSLNHPLLAPWDWQYGGIRLDRFDVIELWNDPTYPGNEEATERALRMWDMLWKHGRLLWGIGGSDTHNLPHESYTEGGPPSIVGDPMTCVLASECSPHTILEGIRKGRCYVTRGPILEPKVVCGDRTYLPGEQVDLDMQQSASEATVRLEYELKIQNAPEGSLIYWIENGETRMIQPCDGSSMYKYAMFWKPDGFHWIRAEVRDADKRLLAIVNPVYSGSAVPSVTYWSELMELLGY
ncbi:CehA/McbA family metallohydrolase [Paenibacillus sp. MZ04-78.2]|uniref:CehA/McbA family metallohydrolase n=1 Tax=Paenibacillus sp. MZ04-78.2 TaxID=2962034 RepID=UPI0020B6E9BA|nr:CehA/McbA family metallohydrolase [Paenibacillus sp. MZ04-78.2]MCP3776595.1 CehA/McbA family metallohydrolase [Paenibacillus sp. MZ04-78.2]